MDRSLPPTRRAESLRECLESDIATGAFPAGTRLDEVKLASRFGVSRTPIREALIELSASGLVEIRPRRGAFVREISIPRLVEMFEVMAEYEAMCGRLAARRITSDELATLQAAHEACQNAETDGDPDGYFHSNQTFHEVIYLASHNGFLAEQARTLSNRLKAYRRLQLHVRNRVASSLAEHQAIVDAISTGDSESAATALRAHVLIQGERFNDFVSQVSRHQSEPRAILPAQQSINLPESR